ncbi:hypothetical protein Tco_0803152 [Tanacetum coccineum]|uniref:Uncharacterized protein n=1 Tax=Tanacetum coccineum TaxID=301880 RepID=A0ABQ5A0S1_9ASTR
MANIRTCNKHNMIACVEKTAQNADFYQIIDFLTGCSINYSLLVDPDLIGPWLQQFWATATLQVINDVPHIRAKVAGKKILISEATIRADLLFDDENGVDCFPKQVIWDTLRDIGYEGNLAQLTFSKPLFSPQWKYLIHVLLHCLSPKSTSWEQFGTKQDMPLLLPLQLKCAGSFSNVRLQSKVLIPFKYSATSQGTAKYKRLLTPRRVRRPQRSKLFLQAKQKSSSSQAQEIVQIPSSQMVKHHALWKSDGTEAVNIEEKNLSNVKVEKQRIGIIKAKGYWLKNLKKKKLTLQQIRALETTNDEEVAKKNSKLSGKQRRKKEFEELKKNKPRDYFEETTSLAQKKKSNDEFPKRSRIQKFLQKLK